MSDKPQPSKKAEYIHAARAVGHVLLGTIIFFLGGAEILEVVFAYSVWALVESAIGAWQGARAARRSLENP